MKRQRLFNSLVEHNENAKLESPWFPNPQGFRNLYDLLTRENLDIVLLQETKVRSHFFDYNKFKLGLYNVFAVDCVDKSGGLALLWKYDIFFEILNFYVNHIQCLIIIRSIEMNLEESCLFTRIYGHPPAH